MKRIYLPLVISLVLVLGILGLTGCSPQTYTLTTVILPSDGGSVSPSGSTYDDGTAVTLTATPASGYAFDYWSGAASGTNPNTTLVMDADKNATAHFVAVGPAVLFYDDFSDPGSGWETYDHSDGGAAYDNGAFYVWDYTTPVGSKHGAAQRYFTDFALEVETWLADGTEDSWCSVLFRYQDNGNYYIFSVSDWGNYAIQRRFNSQTTTFAHTTYSEYINQGVGAVNYIRIECIGSSLSFYVNGQLLEQVADSALSGGDICLGANAQAETYAEVGFDNLLVTEPYVGYVASAEPTVLFSDDFSRNNGEWEVYSNSNGQVFYEDGWLHVLNYTTAPYDTMTMSGHSFSDFVLELHTKLADGDDDNWHGVICRCQDNGSYYVFNISADGYYLISRFLNYEQLTLVDATYSTYIDVGQGAVNAMRIECIGSSLSLYVNGHLLAQVNDSAISSGYLGLLATSWSGSFSEVAFDNLVITDR